jgi:Tfp pilus assembly protein PilF
MQQLSDVITQLENFLRSDPQNDTLRAEVFETSLRAGDLARAEKHLREALSAHELDWGWRLRRAHLLMARHRWLEAAGALDELRQHPDAPARLVETATLDAAQVELQRGDAPAGIALLRPLVDSHPNEAPDPALQVLWLRLLHHGDALQQALDWATSLTRKGHLAPAAAGVASLAALDLGDLATCRRWAEVALQQPGVHMEALVARASLALAEEDTPAAVAWLNAALQHNPGDGRARSAFAFAELQAGRLDQSRREFEIAVSQLSAHIGTWHGLGWACLLQGDLPAARKAFETALNMDRNFAESHGGLAVVQAREGKVGEATASIDRAMRLDRSCLSAHYAKALLDGTAHDVRQLQWLARQLLVAKRDSVDS